MNSIANWSRGQNNFSHLPFALGQILAVAAVVLRWLCIHFGHCYLRDNCNKH